VPAADQKGRCTDAEQSDRGRLRNTAAVRHGRTHVHQGIDKVCRSRGVREVDLPVGIETELVRLAGVAVRAVIAITTNPGDASGRETHVGVGCGAPVRRAI